MTGVSPIFFEGCKGSVKSCPLVRSDGPHSLENRRPNKKIMVQRGSYLLFLALILGVLWPPLARTETGQIGGVFLNSVQGAQAQNSVEIFPGDSFEAAVEALNPGETLIVHEGTYQDSGRLSIQVKGTPTAPVIIQKAPGEARPLITRSVNADQPNSK